MPRGEEFEALEMVAGNFQTFIEPENFHPETLLSEVYWSSANGDGQADAFFARVNVRELKLVIELAERYADLCD